MINIKYINLQNEPTQHEDGSSLFDVLSLWRQFQIFPAKLNRKATTGFRQFSRQILGPLREVKCDKTRRENKVEVIHTFEVKYLY